MPVPEVVLCLAPCLTSDISCCGEVMCTYVSPWTKIPVLGSSLICKLLNEVLLELLIFMVLERMGDCERAVAGRCLLSVRACSKSVICSMYISRKDTATLN